MSKKVTSKVKDLLKKGEAKGDAPFGMLFKQLLVVVLIITALTFIYGRVAQKKETEVVSLGVLSSLVTAKQVKQIEVYGNDLQVVKLDGTKLLAHKEKELSASETLLSYGVSTTTLASTSLLVKGETAGSIVLAILPILLPFLFIGFTIWWLARGVKGANMQALSFGQSKAKVIMPDDTRSEERRVGKEC